MRSDAPSAESADSRDPLEELAERFLERHRRGERPTIEEYVEQSPELAPQIRELFPTLLAMEELGPVEDTETGPLSPVDCQELKRLGEYRILGEIGRGGMGIVYEAEQESLGRRVALKVLPFRAFADEVQLERFRHEARAAARLHHTNIVPVFGVGEDEGVHYYAMQYIHGQSLADVLAEVKRLRGQSAPPVPVSTDAAADVALRLVSGEWKAAETGSDDTAERSSRLHRAPTGMVAAAGAPGASREAAVGGHLLAADGSTTSAGEPNEPYYRSVARIGLQVAEALSYAHGEGILHRDIKPSNLLLDMRGVVWVTDFGLAKADESSDLTDSGSIVGTLRYIAPERLAGTGDARSDLYSLGVTLYELLTLRPAFAASDRVQLLDDVKSREPQPLRSVDPRVPRDLETVVLKSIAKAPQDRYRGAQALADDLRRFINFEPVTARRATVPERLFRWCQRNPTVAAMSVAIGVLVVTLAIGGVISAGRLHDRLIAAKLEEGRAWRRSGAIGQRTRSLEAFREAAVGSSTVQLRSEIIGSLALTDLVVTSEWDSPEGFVGYDQFGERVVTNGPENRILVLERESLAGPIAALEEMQSPAEQVLFSPSARYLIVKHRDAGTPTSCWDIDRERLLFTTRRRSQGLPAAFSPDESFVAQAESHGTIVLRSLPEGREIRRFDIDWTCRVMSFAPDGRRLAIAGHGADRHVVHIVDIETEEVIARLHHGRYVTDVAWHPDGELLATSCFDFNAYVWETSRGRRAYVLKGHRAEVVRVFYSHDGRFLATTGWDNQTILWPSQARRPLVVASGFALPFGRDSRSLLYRLGHYRQGRWRIEGGQEHALLDVATLMPTDKSPDRVAVSPDGRWIAAGTMRGVHVWSSERPSVAAELVIGQVPDLVFDPRDGSLLVGQDGGTTRWPVREDATSPGESRSWTFGPPERVVDVGGRVSIDAQGRILAVIPRDAHVVDVFDLERPEGPVARLKHAYVARVDVSPSGDRVATGTWHGSEVRVWDLRSGEVEKEFAGRSAMPRFSPDGNWIAISRGENTTLYRTGTWSEHLVVPRERGSDVAVPVAFTSDSRLVGMSPGGGRLTLYSIATREEIATLLQPDDGSIDWCVFGPDGAFLVVASQSMQVARLWDLRAIRDQLATFDLDWTPRLAARNVARPPPVGLRVEHGEAGQTPPTLSEEDRQLFLSDALSRAVELDPSAANYRNRAEVLERLGDLGDALHDLDRAIELAPEDDALVEKRGLLQVRLQNWDAALEDLDRAISLRQSRLAADPSAENHERLQAALRARASVREANPHSSPP